ncbi:MAG: RdgB/HAM1 family non-canonical purine NTP pyrophosphatase [Lachnospiraceae bacterium]|nr:RdgB/HAM1 family non-canonical purine NTP pyrophosphatase [Lachnospiraceae bacterium]
MINDIVFATTNDHKMVEIREILADLGLPVRSMKEVGINPEITEDGETFEENAVIKARAVHELLPDSLVLADDSGLEVDALGKEPGVYSSRWLGEDTSYDVKNTEIIRRLEGLHGSERSARFRCAIAAVFPDGSEAMADGTIEGEIGFSQAGANGFGYDPIFYLPSRGMTTAELSPEEKNKISHRGRALEKIKPKIREWLLSKSGDCKEKQS